MKPFFIRNCFLALIFICSLLTSCASKTAYATENKSTATTESSSYDDLVIDTSTENGSIISISDDATAVEIVKDMGIGINLGNTLESCGDWITNKTVNGYETAWGSCTITEDIIKGFASEGFRSVRIPVAWSNLMSTDGTYTIDSNLMARVTQIAKLVTDNNMYAVVNIHWDGGWWDKFPTDETTCMAKYTAIWKQVAANFKDFDNRLILESLNEEGGWSSVWNQYSGTTVGKAESYGLLNKINQTFTTIVRNSGSHNATRLLLIAGYNTGIDTTCDSLFKMPTDPANKCAISVHYYTPSTFAILTEDASWGKNAKTWGTNSEKAELATNMNKMKTHFVDKGIPVIIGEYGCPKKNKDADSVRLYLSSVCQAAYENNMCPMLWDTYNRDDPTSNHYNRATHKMVDNVLRTLLRKVATETR